MKTQQGHPSTSLTHHLHDLNPVSSLIHPRSGVHTLALWAHLWADRSTRGSPVAASYAMASRQVSRQAEPSTPHPDFSAPISRMPPQSLASHHRSSHSTYRGMAQDQDCVEAQLHMSGM